MLGFQSIKQKRQLFEGERAKRDTFLRRTKEEEEDRARKMSDENAGTTTPPSSMRPRAEKESLSFAEEERRRTNVKGGRNVRARGRPETRPNAPGETLTFERLDTETPLLKTSTGETYEGYYERTVGEALIVELQQPALDANATSSAGRSGKKRVILNANGEEEEEEEDGGGGANVRAATETRLKFRKRL